MIGSEFVSKALKKACGILKNYYFIIFSVIALLVPDLMLKSVLGEGFFKQSYVGNVNGIFTAGWILLIIVLSVFVLPKLWGKITFAITSLFFTILSLCQYIYFKIFDQFFWIKSVLVADEGANYLDYAIKMIDLRLAICTLVSVISLIMALIFWKSPTFKRKQKTIFFVVPALVLLITHICMQPELHGDPKNEWDTWRRPRIVYKNFNDANKSIEISGFYQFTFRDIFKTICPIRRYGKKDYKRIDDYFEKKGEPPVNEYTGFFEGKNVIAVMMESIDTWTIDKKRTPTLYKMMKNGIEFTNYNAPFFGVGFTFSSEFAFNTGFFTPVSAVSASNFSSNSFPYALARLFKEKGYSANSFHFNSPEFYNRGIMHKSFGCEKYHSLSEFGITGTEAELDSNILRNDELYNKMTEKTPFYSFFITYSAHLPYSGDSAKLELAKEYRPDLINSKIDEEKNNMQILAADTDKFFEQLLKRLEEDGLLENTVIIAYTDHFAYGISDQEKLSEWKGNKLSYNVPAFIYAKGLKPQKIRKPMMTIDWAPTIVNLFGLERDGRYIGNDIFEPSNKGFALFETWGWMDDKMYYVPSEDTPPPDKISYVESQNSRVKEALEINDAVVLGDYYKKR